MTHLNHIDGQWVGAATGATFEDRSPADERDLIGSFPDSGAEDVARAVASVAEAWPAWAAASPEVRADALFKAADIMSRNRVSIDIGPTRHGITQGTTIYFFDPSGNRLETFAGGYQWYPDNPPITWSWDEVGRGIFYHDRKLNDAFLGVVT